VTGSFTYTLGRPGYIISGPIGSLTGYSSDVFTGVVSAARAHVSRSGDSIATDYDVDVDEVFKGSARPHGSVVVEIEGGRVTFPDGTWAEVRLTNEERADGTIESFTPPSVGERFAFFCNTRPFMWGEAAAAHDRGMFFLNYGVFGLYELTREGIVNARGPTRDISARYRNQPADAFLREIRDSLPRITGKFRVTVDSPARVGMPIWVHADVEKELLAYPYSHDLRDIDDDGAFDSCNHIELKRNGQTLVEQFPEIVVRAGPVCGSAFLPDSPRNRLPLHLAFKIDQPGHYSVRWTIMRPGSPAWSGQQSDWTDFDVIEASRAEREASLTKLMTSAPSTTGKFIAEYLPALLATPSDPRVAQALVDALESPLDPVSPYARGSLYLCPADVLAPLLLKALRDRGPSQAMSDAILWRSAWFQDVREDIVRAATSSLASEDDRRVAGALRMLGGLNAFDWRGDSSVTRETSQTIERAAPTLLTRSYPVANETVMLLGSVVRTDVARELLWQAVEKRPDVREQAAIAIAWIHDPRDVSRLSGNLTHPLNGADQREAAARAGVRLRSRIASERVEGADALIDICMRSRSFGPDCRDAVDDVTRRQVGTGPEDVSAESWRDAALISSRFHFGNPSNLLVQLERDGATDALIAYGEQAVQSVAEVLKVAGPARRRLAAFVLGAIGNTDSAEALREALRSESDPTVRQAIQHALDHFGERPAPAPIR
jgi:hypothetical protein